MPVDFPASPTLNQQYTYNGRTWQWDGSAWYSVSALNATATLAAANTFTVGPQTIQTGADSNKGLIVKNNSATQSANLQEWQNSSGTAVASINPIGVLFSSSVELGNASDTTLARVSAGVVSIEGVNVVTTSSTDTLTNKTLTTPTITQGTRTPTFTTNAYTLVLADQGSLLLASNSTTAGTINIPTNASVAFPTGTQIHIAQTGTGQLTITATTPATTTINSNGATAASPKLRAQYSSLTCIKTATDTWLVVGDIV